MLSTENTCCGGKSVIIGFFSCRNATKCRGRVASLEQDVEGTEAAMARLREELRNLEDQAVKMLEKHKELVVSGYVYLTCMSCHG